MTLFNSSNNYQTSSFRYRTPGDLGTVDSGIMPENNPLMNKPTTANNTIFICCSSDKVPPLKISKTKNKQNIITAEPEWIIKTE